MLPYIARRLLWLPVLLSIIIFITFTLGFYGPGGPEVVLLGQSYDPDSEVTKAIRAQWGMDDPFHIQYLRYLRNYATLNLGESLVIKRYQPIVNLFSDRLPVTMQLSAASLLLGIPTGIFLGVVAALARGSQLDRVIIFTTTMVRSIPVMASGPILLTIFAGKLRILPAGGWDGIFSTSAILPVLLMASGAVGGYARLTRANVLEVIASDYVRTAKAKGLTQNLIVMRHILRNAFIPLVTFIGFALGSLVEGALITETLFGIPGMGQLGFIAINSRDYPVLIALTVLTAVSFTLANLIADLMYGVVDPRIRHT